MVAYATADDLYKHGLPRGLLVEQSRQIVSVDAATDRLTLEAHGLAADDVVQFVVDPGATLPDPLSTSTTYYAAPVSGSESLFQVSASEGGAAVDLTDTGSGTFGIVVPLGPTITAVLEYYSRFVDRMATNHVVPFTSPYPNEVVATVAKLAARELLHRLGERSEAIELAAARAERELKVWMRGAPLRDSQATTSANRSQSWGDSARDWGLADGRVI